MADAAAFKKLTQREHVLARPGMYIGSVEAETCAAWVVDLDATEGPRMKLREDLSYVPGLFKIYDEIVVNAVDHATRLKRQRAAGGEGADAICPVKRIAVGIDRATGVIEVTNDGDGIPVEMHPEHKCYVPELIFGHLLTSANYDDEAEAASAEGGRTIGGQNGIGAKACNIFCKWFEVETVDRVRKKVYVQRFEDNMSRALPPSIKACAKKPYMTVRFLPDYERFGLGGGLTDDMYALMTRRVYDATAVTDADVAVLLDGKKVDAKSFERYVDLYLGPKGQGRAYERVNDGWEVAAGLSDGSGMQQVSFVNGVATLRGGKHVDHVVQQICKRLGDSISAKKKDVTVRPQYIKDSLFVFVRATVPNPSFDSQSKETLTTPVAKFGAKIELSDKFIEKLYKLEGLVDRVAGLSDVAAAKGLKKTDGSKRSTIYGIKKLDDAEWAGTAKSQQCTLILTEGDSAKSMAIAGLSVVGRQKYGVFPLRGKLMNVCDVSADKIAANEEISNLKKILGLQTGKTYTSTSELRYGRIMAMTDQDTDGTHIRGLLFNVFLQLWPSLLKIEGFMTAMLTPIVKAVHGRSKQELCFYNTADFDAWRDTQQESGTVGHWKSKYYKGLATSTDAEAREYFKKMRMAVYKWDEETSKDALCLSFDKKRADDRKAWLQTYDARETLDYGREDVTYRDFVDLDLKHFSNYDVLRSIPSVVDGFKISQRKALFGCLKRNLKEEMRVAQLAAYVSEHSMFHHGETSMQGTLIGMAQNFVGSNNIILLEPVGQFGSRLAGGSNHGSPRYIHTHLTEVARAIFHREDEAVLRYLEDDGVSVEPEFYLPVLPMALVNGATGIGTGYSTSVPCYNPRDLISALRVLLKDGVDAELSEPMPWYSGFTGLLTEIKGRLCSRGIVRRAAPTKLQITELPLGYWTEDFKEALEGFIEKQPGAKSYSNASQTTTVDFTLVFDTKETVDGWLAPDEHGVSRFEHELKMVSNKGLSTTNMHMFNARGQIRKYDSAVAVIREFFVERLTGYVRRRELLLAALARDEVLLVQKVAFLDLVIGGKLELHKKESGEELDAELESHGLVRVDGSYKFLLGMAMSSLTRDRKAALELELSGRKAEIVALEATDARRMWATDLDTVASHISRS
jgi:DNA topoisomerase-2